MKKLLYLFGAMALMLGMVACGEDNNTDLGGDFLDNVTQAGFYVYGPATGAENVVPDNMMSRGINEVDKSFRPGMYEKYIWLEGGKDLWLAEYKGGELHYYSAVLGDIDLSQYDENPQGVVKGGKLMTEADIPAGMQMPSMQVPEDGFYHIIFDTNSENDLPQAQIIIMPVEWYINGGKVLGEEQKGTRVVAEDGTITWTWEEVELSAGAAFKFRYDNGAWKINLDSTGNVKAEISLGDKMDGENTLSNYTDKNISEWNDIILKGEAGVYKVSMIYKKTSGEVGDSFKYTLERIRDLDSFLVGGFSLTPVNGDAKNSWAVAYLTAGAELKAESKVYNRETKQWVEETVATKTVETTGLTLIMYNTDAANFELSEAKIFGLGDAFGGWDNTNAGQVPFTVNADGTASAVTSAAGVLRAFVQIDGIDAANVWKAEFSIFNGKIVYRGNGGDFGTSNAISVEAEQTVTFDFNNGIGWINK